VLEQGAQVSEDESVCGCASRFSHRSQNSLANLLGSWVDVAAISDHSNRLLQIEETKKAIAQFPVFWSFLTKTVAHITKINTRKAADPNISNSASYPDEFTELLKSLERNLIGKMTSLT
jgi:hypothetical protein